MKKTFLSLSIISVVMLLFACNFNKKEQASPLVGKWEKANTDSISYVLELTADHAWKYYQDNELLEEGTFAIEGDKFIMKHAEEEDHGHEHGDGEEHEHQHKHADDHVYNYTLNNDKSELTLMHGDKSSVFKKL